MNNIELFPLLLTNERAVWAQKLRMLPPVPNNYVVIWMILGPHQVSKSKVNLIMWGLLHIKIASVSWHFVPIPSWQAFWPPRTRNCPFGCGQKSALNHLGKRFHPLPQTGNVHMEATHFKKGLPLIQCKSYSFSIVWQSKNQSNVCLCPCFVWYSNSCSPFQNSLWLIGLWAIIWCCPSQTLPTVQPPLSGFAPLVSANIL